MYRKDKITNAEVFLKTDESVDHLIKRFKRQVKKCGVLEEIREKEYFVKPSVIKHRDKLRKKALALKSAREKKEEK